jgi:hypothetical protein
VKRDDQVIKGRKEVPDCQPAGTACNKWLPQVNSFPLLYISDVVKHSYLLGRSCENFSFVSCSTLHCLLLHFTVVSPLGMVLLDIGNFMSIYNYMTTYRKKTNLTRTNIYSTFLNVLICLKTSGRILLYRDVQFRII